MEGRGGRKDRTARRDGQSPRRFGADPTIDALPLSVERMNDMVAESDGGCLRTA